MNQPIHLIWLLVGALAFFGCDSTTNSSDDDDDGPSNAQQCESAGALICSYSCNCSSDCTLLQVDNPNAGQIYADYDACVNIQVDLVCTGGGTPGQQACADDVADGLGECLANGYQPPASCEDR